MKAKKVYPYPSYKNPVRLSPQVQKAQKQLKELSIRIMANEPLFQRKNDKIPALPFWFEMFGSVVYYSWCFECFTFIREALRHGIIKNRNDARFWGLKEKKALCGYCLAKKLGEMTPRKRHLWSEYQKRGYWRIN
jgi:hypothetical protein